MTDSQNERFTEQHAHPTNSQHSSSLPPVLSGVTASHPQQTQLCHNHAALHSEIFRPESVINLDSLFDCLVALVTDCNHPAVKRTKNIDLFLNRYAQIPAFVQSNRLRVEDFELIKLLGRGAFGKVELVRFKRNNQVYAMKSLNKCDMIKRSETAMFWEERNIMLQSTSRWLVKLHYAFQDQQFLYMLMDYMPGGDLVFLLSNYDFSEKWARFYTAEILLAVEALHNMGFIHRDLKPDNMLLDMHGHLKLADFGTCMKIGSYHSVKSSAAVGTPDYISPEVLKSQGEDVLYSRECDLWSVGVVLYEMLIGEAPFFAESLVGTYSRIMDHKNSLQFPGDVQVSAEAKHLIRSLLTDRDHRLGREDINDVKAHVFFCDDHWTFETIHECPAPKVPELSGECDTSNFEEIDPEYEVPVESFAVPKAFAGNNLPFIGFTFSQDYQFGDKFISNSQASADDSELSKLYNSTVQQLESAKDLKLRLQEEKMEVERKLSESHQEIREVRRRMEMECEARSKLDLRVLELQRQLDEEQQSRARDIVSGEQLERQLGEAVEKLQMETELALKLKKQLSEKTAISVTQEKSNQELCERLNTSQNLRKTFETELLTIENRLANEISKYNQLIELNQELERRRTSLQQELKCSQQREQSLCEETRQLSDRLVAMEKETTVLRLEVRALTQKGEQDRQALTELQQRSSSNHETSVVEQIKEQLNEERLARQKSEKMVQERERQVSMLNVDFNNIQRQLQKSDNDYKLQMEKLSNLQTDIDQERQTRTQSQTQLSSVQAQLHVEQARVQQLTRQLHEQKHDLCRQMELSSQAQGAQLQELGEQLETEQRFGQLYKAQVQELSAELQEKCEAVSRAQRERVDVETQLASALERVDTEMLQRLQSQQTVAQLEREKMIQDVETKQLRCELEDSERQLATAREEHHLSKESFSKQANNSSVTLDEIGKLQKQLKQEKLLKMQAVNKLAEVMNRKETNSRNNKVTTIKSSGELRRKEKECRRLQQQLTQERETSNQMISQIKEQLQEQQLMMTEDLQFRNKLQMELDSKDSEIEQLKQKLVLLSTDASSSTSLSAADIDGVTDVCETPLEGWLSVPNRRNVRRSGWRKQYVVVSSKKLLFYNSESDRERADPVMVLDLCKLFHVRPVTQGDVMRADPKDIPRVFQLLYAGEGENRKDESAFAPSQQETEKTTPANLNFKNHQFVPITFHMPTTCETCSRPLWHMFKPPQALECARCHVRIHSDHLERRDELKLGPCKLNFDARAAKELLLMAPTLEEQKQWTSRLARRIQRSGYKAAHDVAKISHRESVNSTGKPSIQITNCSKRT